MSECHHGNDPKSCAACSNEEGEAYVKELEQERDSLCAALAASDARAGEMRDALIRIATWLPNAPDQKQTIANLQEVADDALRSKGGEAEEHRRERDEVRMTYWNCPSHTDPDPRCPDCRQISREMECPFCKTFKELHDEARENWKRAEDSNVVLTESRRKLIRLNDEYRVALEKVKAHGCCVMHSDSGCPGCIASDALAWRSKGGEERG